MTRPASRPVSAFIATWTQPSQSQLWPSVIELRLLHPIWFDASIHKTTDWFIYSVDVVYPSATTRPSPSTSQIPATPARTNDVTGQLTRSLACQAQSLQLAHPPRLLWRVKSRMSQTFFLLTNHIVIYNFQMWNLRTGAFCRLDWRETFRCSAWTDPDLGSRCDVTLTAHWLRAG